MFIKYIRINLKKHFLRYFLIILLETALLCTAFTAEGIAFDTASDRNYSQTVAKTFRIKLRESIPAGDLRKKIDLLISELPVSYRTIVFSLANEERDRFYSTVAVFSYADYESMCEDLCSGAWDLNKSELPTREQFDAKEKVAIVGCDAGEYWENGEYIPYEYQFTDSDHILVYGEEFLVVGHSQNSGVHIFFEHLPDDVKIKRVSFELKEFLSKEETDEVRELAGSYFDVDKFEEPRFDSLLDTRKSSGIVMLSVLVMCMSVFNTLLVFKYMLSSRKKYFALLRFNGFKKSDCILYSGIEFLFISAVSAIVSFFVFSKLMMPLFAQRYSVFSERLFTPDHYAAMFGIFFGISAAMFAVYIAPSLSKSVTAEFREI